MRRSVSRRQGSACAAGACLNASQPKLWRGCDRLTRPSPPPTGSTTCWHPPRLRPYPRLGHFAARPARLCARKLRAKRRELRLATVALALLVLAAAGVVLAASAMQRTGDLAGTKPADRSSLILGPARALPSPSIHDRPSSPYAAELP